MSILPDAPVPGGIEDDVGGVTSPFPLLIPAADRVPAPPRRELAEASLVQRDGDRLYALSRYGHLSIVDLSEPRAPDLLGDYKWMEGKPVALEVQGTTVFAALAGTPDVACALAECFLSTTSRVHVLDVGDPAHPAPVGEQLIPGAVVGFRRSGNLLYVATLEPGPCEGCDETGFAAVLTSFDIADAGAFHLLDQLRFEPGGGDPAINGPGLERGVVISGAHAYVSSWDQGRAESRLQIVDLGSPDGALVPGATVAPTVRIASRWQLDELDRVLRVLGRAGGAGSSAPVVLETFRVDPAGAVEPLGRVEVAAPGDRTALWDARFDGPRAYALSLDPDDPLFAFDLSDPASPRAMGALDLPGWVKHVEPRGERLFVLGVDAQSALQVSLFDVSDVERPELLDRAAFGREASALVDTPQSLHTSLSVLDEAGLVVVPYGAYADGAPACAAASVSQLQLLDFTPEGLTLRGAAPLVGRAQGALWQRDHVLSLDNATLQTFDVGDRTAPAAAARLDLAHSVSRVRVVDEHVLRLGNDWWTDRSALDLAPLASAARPDPLIDVDGPLLLGGDTSTCGSAWHGELFVHGDYLYVPRGLERESPETPSFTIIDLRERSAPRAIGRVDLEPFESGERPWAILQTARALLVARLTTGQGVTDRFVYDVIDLAEPAEPRVVTRFELPEPLARWGFALARDLDTCSFDLPGPCRILDALTTGDVVVHQRAEFPRGSTPRVRLSLDRVDFSDPANPVVLPPVDVPGFVLHFDPESGSIVTVDYQDTFEESNGCTDRGFQGTVVDDHGRRRCSVRRRSLNGLRLVGDRAALLSRIALDGDDHTIDFAVSKSRVFYTTAPVGDDRAPVTLHTLVHADGVLEPLPSMPVGNLDDFTAPALRARGERAVLLERWKLRVVDTSAPDAPTSASFELPYGDGYCRELVVEGDHAYCAFGDEGIAAFDLRELR